MGWLDAALHLADFLWSALSLGLLSALLAKGLWHREFRSCGVLRLALWTGLASLLALTAGLLLYGRDGKLASYAAAVAANALALAWLGWGPKRV